MSTTRFWGSLARLHTEQGSTPSFPSINITRHEYDDDNDGDDGGDDESESSSLSTSLSLSPPSS
jgi:hypothetical protein